MADPVVATIAALSSIVLFVVKALACVALIGLVLGLVAAIIRLTPHG